MSLLPRALALPLAFLVLSVAAPVSAEVYVWVMNATEDQVNNSGEGDGSTDSDATGLGVIVVDTTSGVLTYYVDWNELEGDLTAIHVHGPASPGTSTMPHIFNIFTAEDDVIDAGVDRTTDFTAASPDWEDAVLDTRSPFDPGVALRFMLEERGYVNIHSNQWPRGEIRADLVLRQGERIRTDAQRKCTNKINRRFLAMVEVQGVDLAACLRDAADGDVVDMDACIDDDRKDRIDGAADATDARLEARCWGFDGDGIHRYPLFGAPTGGLPEDASSSTIDVVVVRGAESAQAVARAILGDDLQDAVIASADDATGATCQRKLYKRARACQETLLDEFNACKRVGLRGGRADELYEGAPDPFAQAADLELCLGFDPEGAVAAACGQAVEDTVGAECGGVDLAEAAPGCAAESGAELATCVADRVACETCLSLNEVDGMSIDCDLADDGASNASCGDVPE